MNPHNVEVHGPAGKQSIRSNLDGNDSLADLFRRHGLGLNTRCGQRGLCEGCIVELQHGAVEHLRTNQRLAVDPSAFTPVAFRACEYRPADNVIIKIPSRSVLSYAPRVLDDYAIRVTAARDPICEARWGVAIDVGTTTVALLLVDLSSGDVVARASAFNAQMHLGDDVVTRITLCMNDATMLRRMQTAILSQTIWPLLQQALLTANAAIDDVGAIVIAGNTTMLHLLSGEDPTSLGIAPFTPKFTEHRVLDARELSADWEPALPSMPVHLLPSASAYIGADIVAGLVATGMVYEAETALLVDIGTNGEIVLRHNDRLLACATAAGPAFEGARLTSGMRAGHGAITDIRLNVATGAHELRWLGQGDGIAPVGLCGSAYIDFLAEARRAQLLSTTGRFNRDLARATDWHHNGGEALGYRLANAQCGEAISVSECDVAALLTAKAAIAAGIHLLLEQLRLRPADVQHLYLAGGFGTHMNTDNALAIGLLPGFAAEQIIPVGNSALAGAYLALMERSLLADMQHTAIQIEPIELNLIPDFQDAYIDMLNLS